MKLLSGVNLTHKKFDLSRAIIKNYASVTAMVFNIRKLIHGLGYDCSLLSDNEILAFNDVVFEYEQNDDNLLIEILNFLSV
jgi:hypothetical protein